MRMKKRQEKEKKGKNREKDWRKRREDR